MEGTDGGVAYNKPERPSTPDCSCAMVHYRGYRDEQYLLSRRKLDCAHGFRPSKPARQVDSEPRISGTVWTSIRPWRRSEVPPPTYASPITTCYSSPHHGRTAGLETETAAKVAASTVAKST